MFRLTGPNNHSWKNWILLAGVVLFAALQFSGCQMTSADGGTPPAEEAIYRDDGIRRHERVRRDPRAEQGGNQSAGAVLGDRVR